MKKLLFLFIAVSLLACSNKKNAPDAYGNFEADETLISAESSGKLMQFIPEEGDVLQPGTEVGLIDTIDLQLKKQQLLAQMQIINTKNPNIAAQIEVQKQQKSNLLIEKTRIENLLKDGAATKKQWDDINGNISVVDKQIQSIQTQSNSISGELENIRSQIAQMDQNLKKCHLVNPIKGTVITKFVNANELVSPGKVLYKIADVSNLFLRAYITNSQLSSIKIGDKVTIKVDKEHGEMATYTGEVTWISSTAEFTPKIIQTKEERQNLVYAIKVKVPNDGYLKIGMPGELYFK
jgi:HlyD family secretion protein